jgi:hypothetical protein
MLRTLTRWIGYLMLAAAMALGIHDGARSVAISDLELTPLGTAAFWLLPRHFPILEPAVTRHVHPLLWDPVLLNFFLLPAVAIFFALGGIALYFGQRPRQPAVGS